MKNPVNLLRKMPILLKIAGDYDLLHFHYSSGLPFGLDFPLWRLLGKKLVMHHHGTDIRGKGERFLYSRLADRILVSTPDLLKWSRDAIWLPNPLDLERYPHVGVRFTQSDDEGPIRILHAPSRRWLKGTEHVLRAIRRLKDEGYDIELILVENTPHDLAIEYYKKADIVVDQLLIGWYGMLAQECMALGKPVCVYLREDLLGFMPFQPMMNTGPERLQESLRELIEDTDLRMKLGGLGRRYVQELHSSDRIASRLMQLYK